jgi:hypothetical protein
MLRRATLLHLLVGGAVISGAGCGHSSSFVTSDDRSETSFGTIVPVRLTFDAGADIHPLWAADGSALLYSYERLLPFAEYADRCLGALPPDGGQRVHEWCWSTWDEATRRDGIEWGTLDASGRLLFVHHFSAGDKQPLPFSGFVYQGTVGSIVSPLPLAELMVPQVDAAAPWDYLTGTVFTGPNEVTALATAIAVNVNCLTCPFDTTWTGADLVRISLQSSPRLERLAQLHRAAYLSWDRSVGRFFFGRDGRIETVPTNGGEVRFVWQVPRSPDRKDVTLSGVAAGAGRVATTFYWMQGDTVGSPLHSVVGVLEPGGDVAELAHDSTGVQWGEMTLSPDGRKLVVERRIGTERDLYMFNLPD